MVSLESIFVREFRNSVKEVGYKDIFKIPLPECVKGWNVSGTELYGVKNIDNEDFKDLNQAMVRRLPSGTVVRQRVIDKALRQFSKDEDGNYVYKDIQVPTGSMVVLSQRNLSVPYKYWNKFEGGYGYVDYNISEKYGMEYIYILPKSVLYKIHQTALVLSVKNMKNYAGMGYTTWRSGKIFLHVIPYNPNSQYTGSKVLKTGCTLNYGEEIKTIVDFWQVNNVIPEIRLCKLEDETNLCLKMTSVGYEDYEVMDMLPLSEKEQYNMESGDYSDVKETN